MVSAKTFLLGKLMRWLLALITKRIRATIRMTNFLPVGLGLGPELAEGKRLKTKKDSKCAWILTLHIVVQNKTFMNLVSFLMEKPYPWVIQERILTLWIKALLSSISLQRDLLFMFKTNYQTNFI